MRLALGVVDITLTNGCIQCPQPSSCPTSTAAAASSNSADSRWQRTSSADTAAPASDWRSAWG
jgi:hypothetical protein